MHSCLSVLPSRESLPTSLHLAMAETAQEASFPLPPSFATPKFPSSRGQRTPKAS